jgi:hypothetical protein
MDRASKADLWLKRVRAFERSGLRRRQWCDRNGVALATLDYWRSRLRTAAPVSQSLVPIVVTDAPSSCGSSAPGVIEIECAGVRLRADAGVDAAWLCSVLRGLR